MNVVKGRVELLILLWGVTFPFLLATSASAQPGAPPDKPWSLTAGALETYDDNPGLTTQATQSFGTALQGGLSRDWRLQRGDIKLSGNANQIFYSETPALNNFGFLVGATASYRITRRLSWNAGDGASSSYAQDSTVLTEAGVVLPRVVTHTNTASTGLSYALSPTTQIGGSAALQNVTFDSSELAGASTESSQFFLSRQLSKSEKIGISAQYLRTLTEGTSEDSGGFFGTWQAIVGTADCYIDCRGVQNPLTGASVSASGGVLAYTTPGESGVKYAPGGSVVLNSHPRKSDTLALSYGRTIAPAFGFGRTQINDLLGATYVVNLGQHFGLNANGTYNRGTDVVDPDLRVVGRALGVSMRYSPVRNLSIAAGCTQYMANNLPNQTVTGCHASTGLTYARTWR
jgi:hypothetical protein